MIIKVIAIDPGVTTGYAIGVIENGRMNVLTGQERWNHIEFFSFLEDNEPESIICEKFEFRNRSRRGLELFSRELIGVAQLYAQMHLPPPFELIMQSPGTIGGYFSDSRLKDSHVFKPGRPHANDAARHLLHWFSFGGGYQYNERGYVSAV